MSGSVDSVPDSVDGWSGVWGVVGVPGINVVELSTRKIGRDSDGSSALVFAGKNYLISYTYAL